jgi:predicted dinucleotide-binding enzyme
MDISVIGGTGEEGFGLTLRIAREVEHVIIGSRSAEKGASTAEKAVELLGGDAEVSGTTNEEAAARGDIVFVTVPFGGQADIYRAVSPRRGREDRRGLHEPARHGRRRPRVARRAAWHGSAAEQARRSSTRA